MAIQLITSRSILLLAYGHARDLRFATTPFTLDVILFNSIGELYEKDSDFIFFNVLFNILLSS